MSSDTQKSPVSPTFYDAHGQPYRYEDAKEANARGEKLVLYEENGKPVPRHPSGLIDMRAYTARMNAQKNPGRAKGFAAKQHEKFRADLANLLVKQGKGKKIIDKAIQQAEAGNRHARAWLYERAFGRVPQTVEIQDDTRSEELQALRGALTYLFMSEEDKRKVREGEASIIVNDGQHDETPEQ